MLYRTAQALRDPSQRQVRWERMSVLVAVGKIVVISERRWLRRLTVRLPDQPWKMADSVYTRDRFEHVVSCGMSEQNSGERGVQSQGHRTWILVLLKTEKVLGVHELK